MNRTPSAARPHGEIETIGIRGVEQGRERATEIRRADAGDMDRVEPVLIVGVRQRTAERLQELRAASGAAADCRRCWSRSRESVRRRHWRRCRASCAPAPTACQCRSLPCLCALMFQHECCNSGVILQLPQRDDQSLPPSCGMAGLCCAVVWFCRMWAWSRPRGVPLLANAKPDLAAPPRATPVAAASVWNSPESAAAVPAGAGTAGRTAGAADVGSRSVALAAPFATGLKPPPDGPALVAVLEARLDSRFFNLASIRRRRSTSRRSLWPFCAPGLFLQPPQRAGRGTIPAGFSRTS